MPIKKGLLDKVIKNIVILFQRKKSFRFLANKVILLIRRKRRNSKLPHPISLMVELTNHCQLNCITCPRWDAMGKEMDRGHMDFESLKSLLNENHIYLDNLCLSGLGETFLHPHLTEIVDYINAINPWISIFISTNAYTSNALKIIDAISDKIDTLQISIDGCGKVFENIRRGTSYDKFLDNLKEIARITEKRRVDILFNMVIIKENYHQMPEIIKLAKELDITKVNFDIVNLVANDWDLSYYRFFNSGNFMEKFKEARLLAVQGGIDLGYPNADIPRTFENCPSPWNNFYITWDGFLVPCCARPFPKVKHFGNVFKSGLMDCINSSDFVEFREMSNKDITPKFCRRCRIVT